MLKRYLQKRMLVVGCMVSGCCTSAMQHGEPQKTSCDLQESRTLLPEIMAIHKKAIESILKLELCKETQEPFFYKDAVMAGIEKDKTLCVQNCEKLPGVKSILKKHTQGRRHKQKKGVTFGPDQIHYVPPYKETQE